MRPWRAAVLAGAVLVAAGCTSNASSQAPPPSSGQHVEGSEPPPTPAAVRLPPANVSFDYQLGGNRQWRQRPAVIERDRTAPSAGAYDICYVNGFQAQPDAAQYWRADGRGALILRTQAGKPVTDGNWNEWLLDTSTPAKRRALATIIGAWTDGCARHGFEAVEYDNLDSWTRSRGLLDMDDNLAFAQLLSRRAHHDGLAVAQKNTPQLRGKPKLIAGDFDFAVAEQCQVYRECGSYLRVYGNRVYEIEYTLKGFRDACRDHGDRISVIYRHSSLHPNGPRTGC